LKARDAILRASEPRQLDFDAGFAITGARVDVAVSNPRIRIEALPQGDKQNEAALLKVDMGSVRAASVAIRFADGSGTVIAALKGYVGNITVDRAGVANVSYIPSHRELGLWQEYDRQRERIDRLHATVATSARYGVFRVDASQAARLADTIRVLKGIDPTLGLYAAYAYADADLESQVRSVRQYLRGDLGADLFDVAMLSGELAGRRPDGGDGTVPFCPMLSQGWISSRSERAGASRGRQCPGSSASGALDDFRLRRYWNADRSNTQRQVAVITIGLSRAIVSKEEA
jgi:hypothetical protein